jgi:hypothetical protein
METVAAGKLVWAVIETPVVLPKTVIEYWVEFTGTKAKDPEVDNLVSDESVDRIWVTIMLYVVVVYPFSAIQVKEYTLTTEGRGWPVTERDP